MPEIEDLYKTFMDQEIANKNNRIDFKIVKWISSDYLYIRY